MSLSSLPSILPQENRLQGNLTVTDHFKNPDICLGLPGVYPIPSAVTLPTIIQALSHPVVPTSSPNPLPAQGLRSPFANWSSNPMDPITLHLISVPC